MQKKNGYYVEGVGSSWSMMTDVGDYFGIQGSEISLSKDSVQAELELGHPIICAMRPGDFTTTGHFYCLDRNERWKKFVSMIPIVKKKRKIMGL